MPSKRRCLFRGTARGEHDEFVTAEARRQVAFADKATQALGDALQQLVARGMAVRVVDHLEVVEVEIEQRQRLVAAVPPP